jgi:uncharacterized protein YgiM (DUF1202 family)
MRAPVNFRERMSCIAAVVAVGMSSAALAAPARPTEPYVCNYARTTSQAWVRSGPNEKLAKVRQLKGGEPVFICDETRDWFQVFFGGDCPGSTMGLDSRRTAGCQSGWVTKTKVETLSG